MSGPFVIGWLFSMNFSYLWGFYTFVGAALIACVAVLFVPSKQGEVVQKQKKATKVVFF
jgi:hypothetical protein